MESSSIPWPQLQFTSLITQVVDDVLQRRRQTQAEPADEADVSVIWTKSKVIGIGVCLKGKLRCCAFFLLIVKHI